MPDPRTAACIFYETCEHGTLSMSLADHDGKVFAVAHIPLPGVESLLAYLVENYCREDTIGEVAGHA